MGDAFWQVNIALEVFSALVTLTLLFSQGFKAKKTSQDRLFVAVLAVMTLLLLLDAAVWLFSGKPGGFAYAINHIGSFCVYALGNAALYIYMMYAFNVVAKEQPLKPIARWMKRFIGAISVALFVLAVLNLKFGFYYVIEPDNSYTWGKYDWINFLSYWIDLVFVAIATFSYRKELYPKDYWSLLSFCIFPTLSFLIVLFFSTGIMLHLPAVTLALLVIYINIQLKQEQKLLEQEILLKDANTAIMLSQIQPHFLYNSLSAIVGLCDVEPEKVKGAVENFSHYLRGNLDSLSKRGLIDFEDELLHVETYLSLEKLRYGDVLRIQYSLQVEDFKLPPLTVQPLVENAVKHGITKKHGGGTVSIATMLAQDKVQIRIRDDGAGFDQNVEFTPNQTHVGIENVRQRLASQCKGTLEIESRKDIGTKATITIPYIKEKEGKNEYHSS